MSSPSLLNHRVQFNWGTGHLTKSTGVFIVKCCYDAVCDIYTLILIRVNNNIF